MLERSALLLKKKVPPLGYSKNDFFKKLTKPGASKPWRNRTAVSAGKVELTPITDVLNEEGDLMLGNMTEASSASIGSRSPFVAPTVGMLDTLHAQQERRQQSLLPDSSGHHLPAVAPYEGQGSSPVLKGSERSAPLSTIPIGRSLELDVTKVDTYEDGPVPLRLQALKNRGKKEVADSILLPKHINKLFHKIMGWSEDLAELEEEKKLDSGEADGAPPALLRKKMANLTEKMKYGVLLDEYEKDKFAMEQQLAVAGNKAERQFLEWEGMHVLDQDPSAQMASALEHKAAIVMDSPATAPIPVVNRDCCSGCGALLQDKNEEDFGYVAQGEIEKYVLQRDEKARLRAEYAARMAELQAHWEKHGRQVGEEWLDFMTQDEFDAYYRDRREPFVCHRCHALENLGVTGRRKVWSAPDFTDQLRSLREKKCVVVLVVDITDFPGSMVYDLAGLISMNNDVIIAVNKMDCVRNRSFNYKGKDRAVSAMLVSERYVREWVKNIAVQMGLPKQVIRAVVPISAKRGWNVEVLLREIEDAANLNLRRPHKPLPTYFAGVANVGKSSVINAIAHHLYIPQPPHPESKKVYYAKTDEKTGKEVVLWRWHTPANVNQAEMLDIPSRHDKKASKLLTVSSLPGTTVAVNGVKLSLTGGQSNEQVYLYDTPGLIPHWHRESPLTLYQMRRTLIRRYRNAQCFLLVPGHSVLLGGLAAIDVVKGPPRGLLFMVYTSAKVRNAIISTERSDSFWAEQLGKALDPPSSYEQLLEASPDGTPPSLSVSKSYLFECYDKHRKRPKADVYVCGLGWVSFCVSEPADVVLRVRTLPGVIHGVREPLRYNDLRAFKFWPKLKRRSTSKGLLDDEHGQDTESINTVVRLTTANTQAAGEEVDLHGMAVRPVTKVAHPRHETASDAPLEGLLSDLHSSGKL